MKVRHQLILSLVPFLLFTLISIPQASSTSVSLPYLQTPSNLSDVPSPVTALTNLGALSFFGTGSDGNVTISSGTTLLLRDMQYNNLTVSGTGQINTNGYKIYVAGTLDLSNAPSNAIFSKCSIGVNASGSTGGNAQSGCTVSSPYLIGGTGQGDAGANGTTGAGTTGAAFTYNTSTYQIGGSGGNGGAGGAGT